ncbi:hypothetical protein CGZ96_13320 [Enemella evansiae]|uniref:hypothetical protein n=1 Tax=Enemella evansiae TaxID=2016499 RepID=UPI000B95C993|nr:hypothetical protein [Enemella evansiae]OYN96240.1 hypothetical protein CGZ96_13320 [Enemella evansiae]
MAYRYSNLTAALGDKRSPLREFLDRRFPHVRALQTDFRARSGELRVPGGSADPGQVGAALDLAIRFLLDPQDRAEISWIGFANHARELEQIVGVVKAAQRAAVDGDAAALGRACWVLALTTEVYRVGLWRGSALDGLLRADRFRTPELLGLAGADAIEQLVALQGLAERELLPRLRPPYRLGPTFTGSEFCAADADLIAGGVLIDIKTRLGVRDPKTGVRSDRLSLADVYQLLGYLLFDRDDAYRITDLAIYSARYGALIGWPVVEALQTLAGEPVDLPEVRAEVWSLLTH